MNKFMSSFTSEQLEQLEILYGLKRKVDPSDFIDVKDGWVHKDGFVWFLSKGGPKIVKVSDHFVQIGYKPNFYQNARPIFDVVYK